MIQTYEISASFERDGVLLDCSQAEVIGDAWRITYTNLAAACVLRDQMQSEIDSFDLDPTTVYAVQPAGEIDAVVVEYMPLWLRASHEAARNHGVYPHNGAVRLTMSRDDAEDACDGDDWANIIDGADPTQYDLTDRLPE